MTISSARGGGVITLESGTMNVSGTLSTTATATTYTTTGNTVDLNGANQTIGGAGTATSFGNITTSGSGTKTTSGNFNITGNLSVGSGTTYSMATHTVTVNGTTTVDGTLSFTNNSGTKIFVGAVTVNGFWNNSGNESAEFQSGITNTGTFTAGTGTYSFTTNNQSLTGTFVIPSVTVTGITLTNDGTLTVGTALAGSGTLTQAADATLNIGGTSAITTLNAAALGNTVDYQGATQTVKPNAYHHLTLSGSGVKTLTGVSTISGNFTLSGTATATAAAALTIGGHVDIGAGTTFNASSFTHNVAGNFTNAGTFTASTSTINLNGASAQTITGATTFNNLTLNNSAGLTLSNDATINGILTLTSGKITTGANKVTLGILGSISGAGAGKYINGNLERNYSGAVTSGTFPVGNASTYAPLTLTFITVGTAGTVTVHTTEGPHPSFSSSGLPSNKSLNRFWTLDKGATLGFDEYSIIAKAASTGELGTDFNGTNVSYGKYNGSWSTGTATYTLVGSTTPTFSVSSLASMSDFAFASCASAGTSGNTSVCNTSTSIIDLYSLIGSEDVGGTWTAGGSNPVGGTFTAAAGTFNPSGAPAGTYTFTYTFAAAGGCAVSTSTATVTIAPNTIMAAAGMNISSCATTLTLGANPAGSGETGIWTIQSGIGGSITTPNSPTSTFTGTVAGSPYTLRWTISGSCPSTNDDVVVSITNDLPIVNAVTVVPSANTAALTWTTSNTPGVGTTYELFITTSATVPTLGSTPTVSGITALTYSASVSPGTAYYAYVRGACGINKQNPWIGTGIFNTLCDVTEQPTFGSFTNVLTTTATINWTNGGSSTLTDIYIVATGGAAPTAGTTPTHNNLTGITYNKTALVSGNVYDVYFRGNCGTGNAFGTAWVGPYTLSMQCASTASALTLNDAKDDEATVSWTDAGGSQWQAYLRAPGAPAPVASTTPTASGIMSATHTFTGLDANKAYSWYVRKYCGGIPENTNFSVWSAAGTFTTACDDDDQPTPVSVTVNSATSATFAWTHGGASTLTDIYVTTSNTPPSVQPHLRIIMSEVWLLQRTPKRQDW